MLWVVEVLRDAGDCADDRRYVGPFRSAEGAEGFAAEVKAVDELEARAVRLDSAGLAGMIDELAGWAA